VPLPLLSCTKLRPYSVACYLRTRGFDDFKNGKLVFM